MAIDPEKPDRSLVVGSDSPITRAVVAALEERGHDVRSIDLPEAASRKPDLVRSVFESASAGATVRLVVYTDVPADSARAGRLTDLDLPDWDRACESVVRRTLLTFQAAHRALTDGGTIVLVVPTMALGGSPDFVPWSAAAEAQRVMAKVAARRWGSCAITVNTVAVAPHVLSDDLLPDDGGATTDEADRAAALVCMLAGPDAGGLTGATLVADGGTLMVP